MNKYNITMTEQRVAKFTIEAHSKKEAVDLVANRIRDDDYFCDEVEEMYENWVESEIIESNPADADDHVDYTYAEMVGEEDDV